MKSYLQRLAARSEGARPAPSLVPTLRAPSAASDSESAFVEAAGDIVSVRVARNREETSAPTSPVEPLPGDVPLASPTSRQTSAHHLGNEVNEQAFPSETGSIEPKTTSDERRSGTNPEAVVKARAADGSIEETIGLEPRVATAREPNPYQNSMVPRTAPAKAGSDAPSLQTAPRSQLLVPFEPRLKESPPVSKAVPDEPRLVIGQMRVEVVATPPTKAREVVRTVTRTNSSGSSGTTGNRGISKLRFGLGQM